MSGLPPRTTVAMLFSSMKNHNDKPLLRTGTGMLQVNLAAAIQLLTAISKEYRDIDPTKAAEYGSKIIELATLQRSLDEPLQEIDSEAVSRARNSKSIEDRLTEIQNKIRSINLDSLKQEVNSQTLDPKTPQDDIKQLNNMLREAINEIQKAVKTIQGELRIRATSTAAPTNIPRPN